MFDWKGFLFLNTAAAVVASVVVVAAADVVLAVADVVVIVVDVVVVVVVAVRMFKFIICAIKIWIQNIRKKLLFVERPSVR